MVIALWLFCGISLLEGPVIAVLSEKSAMEILLGQAYSVGCMIAVLLSISYSFLHCWTRTITFSTMSSWPISTFKSYIYDILTESPGIFILFSILYTFLPFKLESSVLVSLKHPQSLSSSVETHSPNICHFMP